MALFIGFLPISPWFFINASISLTNIGKYNSWMGALNHLAATHYGQTMLLILPALFMLTVIGSYITIIAGIATYHRLIKNYFSFHEHRSMSVLTLSAVFYLVYIASTSIAMMCFFFFESEVGKNLPFITIYAKSLFFIFFTYLLIRFAPRYENISPTLRAIDMIETAIESPTDDLSENKDDKMQRDNSSTEKHVKHLKKLPSAPEGPIMRQLLNQWSRDPKKFYLRDDINLLQVAEMIGVRPRFLSEYLNLVWGVNFNQYINQLRIEEAKKLIIEDKSRQITDIAYATGFSSAATFCKVFKRIEGISPTMFRESHLS